MVLINVLSKFGLGNFVPPCCCHPQPGDLIEFDRKLYSHWALYIGEDQVVHVSGESYDIANEGVTVRQSSLEEVAGDSLLRVNNKEVPAKERGLKALETRKIITNARRCVGKVVVHNMLSNNAEHFVTLWRYGVGWSDQVNLMVFSRVALVPEPAGVTDSTVTHTHARSYAKNPRIQKSGFFGENTANPGARFPL